MTKPTFDARISLGNLIQIVLIASAIIGGAQVALSNLDRLESDIGTVKAANVEFEKRLRKVETTTAMQGVDFDAMGSAFQRMEAQMAENNRLLRELLATQGRAR